MKQCSSFYHGKALFLSNIESIWIASNATLYLSKATISFV